MFTSNPETQIEVEALAQALTALPIGKTASYAALSAVVGYDVQRRPFTLMRARRKVEADSGMRFATVRKLGVKKLAANAVAGIGAEARKHIASAAKREGKRLVGLRYNDIDKATQGRIDAERSVLGAISAAAKTPVERVEAEAQTGPIVAARVFDIIRATSK